MKQSHFTALLFGWQLSGCQVTFLNHGVLDENICNNPPGQRFGSSGFRGVRATLVVAPHRAGYKASPYIQCQTP